MTRAINKAVSTRLFSVLSRLLADNGPKKTDADVRHSVDGPGAVQASCNDVEVAVDLSDDDESGARVTSTSGSNNW